MLASKRGKICSTEKQNGCQPRFAPHVFAQEAQRKHKCGNEKRNLQLFEQQKQTNNSIRENILAGKQKGKYVHHFRSLTRASQWG